MVIMPVYNVIILPFTDIFLQMDKLIGVKNQELRVGSQVLFLISKDKQDNFQLNLDSFYPIGVMGIMERCDCGHIFFCVKM